MMTNQKKNTDSSGNALLIVSSGLGLVWVVFTLLFAWFRPEKKSFWALSLNEYGDFFAGFFAPLAFGAVAVAVVLQRFELQAQRMELQQTRELQVPERQKEQINDHMADLFRLMFQLKEMMRQQRGRNPGAGDSFTGMYTALGDHVPIPSNRLDAFNGYLSMITKMYGVAVEVAEESGNEEWFIDVRRKLTSIGDSLQDLDALMDASREARFAIQSYRDLVKVCVRDTTKLSELLRMHSPQL